MLPPVRVREALEAARRAGVPFDSAWSAVLSDVADADWLEALTATVDTWQRAYSLEPAIGGDLAVDLLARGENDRLVDLNARPHCLVCDTAFEPPARGREKLYCSAACRRIGSGRREQLAA